MKIAVLYYSETGNTEKSGKIIANGIKSNSDIDVRLFHIDEIDKEFVRECSSVIIGTPTYSASTCWQLKKWFDDESKEYNLAGKLGCAYATANFVQGGADTSIQSVVNHMLVRGMLVYSSGSALGKPYVHLGAVGITGNDQVTQEMFYTFGRRIAEKTIELFG